MRGYGSYAYMNSSVTIHTIQLFSKYYYISHAHIYVFIHLPHIINSSNNAHDFTNITFPIPGNRFNCNCQILWLLKLYSETESEYVKTELGRLECNMFHTSEQQKHQRHLYNSNVTLEKQGPEETTPFAFDGIKKVIKLDPSDFECHSKDLASVPQSDGNLIRSSDESGEKTSDLAENKNKDLQQSHHQSHVDMTRKIVPNPSTSTGVLTTFSSHIIFLVSFFSFWVRGNLP